MTKAITAFVILFQLAFVSSALCNQKSLDADRTRELQNVFKAVQNNSNIELASCLPGLSQEEASKILKEISKNWGDVTKLDKAEIKQSKKFDKGKMKTIAYWGSESTQTGKWFDLTSSESNETVMRIGLLFSKGSSDPRQFLAVQWQSEPKAAQGSGGNG